MDLKVEYLFAAAIGLVSVVCLKILLRFFRQERAAEKPTSDVTTSRDDVTVEDTKSAVARRRKGGASQRKTGGAGFHADKSRKFAHDWLVCSLKGHSGSVLDAQFSGDAKFLASCADDNTLIIWSMRHLTSSDSSGDAQLAALAPPRSCRVHVELDYAQRLGWSPDARALVVARCGDMRLQVLRLSRRSDGLLGNPETAVDFKSENDNVIGAAIASSGKFIMCCTEGGQLILYDLKANVLTSVDTHQGAVYRALISPCANFVLTAGFTPDVKVWRVGFSKDGSSFERLHQVFTLSGHRMGVVDVDVAPDGHRMLTASKDGTWRLYNTNIEYQLGQDPSTLCSANFAAATSSTTTTATANICACAALSPDGTTVLIGYDSSAIFYSARDASQLAVIENIHTGVITRVMFDPASRLALTAGDRQMHVLYNVPGRQVMCQDLKQKLAQWKNASMKDRIASQLAETKNFIAKFEK